MDEQAGMWTTEIPPSVKLESCSLQTSGLESSGASESEESRDLAGLHRSCTHDPSQRPNISQTGAGSSVCDSHYLSKHLMSSRLP